MAQDAVVRRVAELIEAEVQARVEKVRRDFQSKTERMGVLVEASQARGDSLAVTVEELKVKLAEAAPDKDKYKAQVVALRKRVKDLEKKNGALGKEIAGLKRKVAK